MGSEVSENRKWVVYWNRARAHGVKKAESWVVAPWAETRQPQIGAFTEVHCDGPVSLVSMPKGSKWAAGVLVVEGDLFRGGDQVLEIRNDSSEASAFRRHLHFEGDGE